MEPPDHDALDDEAPVNPTSNPTFRSILAARLSRRGFIAGAGAGLATLAATKLVLRRGAEAQGTSSFTPVPASNEDKLLLPPGYKHSVLLRWGDPIFPGAAASIPPSRPRPARSASSATTMTSSAFCRCPRGATGRLRPPRREPRERAPGADVVRRDGKSERTREMCEVEVAAHGFTVVEVARGAQGEWSVVRDSALNRGSRVPRPWWSGDRRRGTPSCGPARIRPAPGSWGH